MSTSNPESLQRFEGPIRSALRYYSDRAYGAVAFDPDSAVQLAPAEGRPYIARSTSKVELPGKAIGSLTIVAFGAKHGTGAMNERIPTLTDTGRYPAIGAVVPRPKTSTHTEAYLPIAAARGDASPIAFVGSLDLIGIAGSRLVHLATLGTSAEKYERELANGTASEPVVSATVGYYDPNHPRSITIDPTRAERFADPHAVYNSASRTGDIQVAGFLALTVANFTDSALGAFHGLTTEVPALASTDPTPPYVNGR